jgi:NADPH:quinone reductase-like Zn-dependent oxidoreductase
MKAAVYNKYGPPEVLRLAEVEKPVPEEDEVLVKVHAASVNNWDWDLVRGKPYLFRPLFGFTKPKRKIVGSDIAGEIEAVGSKVEKFQPGDEVFGDISPVGFGAFAEYICVPVHLLALKSPRMSFEEAAAVPQAGVLALQGLRDKGGIKAGKKVLINGAGGGVGTFAIQIAKIYGAEVTGVDSGKKFDLMQSLGADHVIDYTQENFTRNGQKYDLILDNIAKHGIFDYKRALNSKGIYAMVGGSPSSILQILFFGPLISRKEGKKIGVLMHKPNPADLSVLNNLFEEGKVKPVIDRSFPLSETAAAIRYLGEGHVLGKVIITIK